MAAAAAPPGGGPPGGGDDDTADGSLELLRATVPGTFPVLVAIAIPEVGDERLARAVARGAVSLVMKEVRHGLRFRSPAEVERRLRDVTRAGCAVVIAEQAFVEETLTALFAVVDTRGPELARTARRGSLTLAGRAHIEAVKERVAEIAVRGSLRSFPDDGARFHWLGAVSRRLHREGSRLDRLVGRGGHEPEGAPPGGAPLAAHGRCGERLDAERALDALLPEFSDLVAYAEDESATPASNPIRQHIYRRRDAAARRLREHGLDDLAPRSHADRV